mgnify:FL=1
MSKLIGKETFKSTRVADIKKYLLERGVSVNGLMPVLVEIASAVEEMMLPLDPNFERDMLTFVKFKSEAHSV